MLGTWVWRHRALSPSPGADDELWSLPSALPYQRTARWMRHKPISGSMPKESAATRQRKAA